MNTLLEYREQLLSGVIYTIGVSVVTLLFSTVIGVLLAGLTLSHLPGARLAVTAYVEVFQNIPYLIVVLFFYFGLAEFGVRLSAVQAVVVGLSLYSAAYTAEALRGGISAVSKGELTAARAFGLRESDIFRRLLLPQAVVYALPSLTNQWVRVIKNTTVLAVIGGGDLLYQAYQLAAQTYEVFTFYAFVAVAYWVMIIPLTRLSARAEMLARWRRSQLGIELRPRKSQRAAVGAGR